MQGACVEVIMKLSGDDSYLTFLVDWLERLESGRPNTRERDSIQNDLESLMGCQELNMAGSI